MVDFRPFRPFIPRLGNGEGMIERVSPPYDVISAEELARLRSNRFNVTNITLGGVDGDYTAAGEALRSWIEEGALAQDRREAFYTYKQTYCEGEHCWQRTGIIGLLAARGYAEGVVPTRRPSPRSRGHFRLLGNGETHCRVDIPVFSRLSPKLKDRIEDLETRSWSSPAPRVRALPVPGVRPGDRGWHHRGAEGQDRAHRRLGIIASEQPPASPRRTPGTRARVH